MAGSTLVVHPRFDAVRHLTDEFVVAFLVVDDETAEIPDAVVGRCVDEVAIRLEGSRVRVRRVSGVSARTRASDSGSGTGFMIWPLRFGGNGEHDLVFLRLGEVRDDDRDRGEVGYRTYAIQNARIEFRPRRAGSRVADMTRGQRRRLLGSSCTPVA